MGCELRFEVVYSALERLSMFSFHGSTQFYSMMHKQRSSSGD
jgi:hypothetical protein